jgi:hypothetical protein
MFFKILKNLFYLVANFFWNRKIFFVFAFERVKQSAYVVCSTNKIWLMVELLQITIYKLAKKGEYVAKNVTNLEFYIYTQNYCKWVP